MFSSGFFLLPGLAAARAGPSAVVAYLIAGLLMVPSMLSMMELSTALPRAGGSYYFLDRSLGPGIGTVTGLGTWLALVFKSAFALVGMGAYLSIMPGLGQLLTQGTAGSIWSIKVLAVVLTILFTAVNILGPRQSTRMQKLMVIAILAVLGFFIVQGLWHIFSRMPGRSLSRQYTPFLHPEHGLSGLAATTGLVFVSYAGLTKVASISEEIRRPERNLPLAMILSLTTATVVYVLGVFIMIAVLDPGQLHRDYAPVASAMKAFSEWLPGSIAVVLVIIAALAAFASTGNAGILSASRYPLAMARDKLLPSGLGKLGRFGTPTAGILLTGTLMVFFILVLSTEGVAKLGSTFNLLIFGLLNLAVLVMRESRIDSYDPGFRVPFYPWLPLAGMIISAVLIIEMGWLAIFFSLGVIIAGVLWYIHYARPKVTRYGAIHHVFARLGRYRHPELRAEFREIIKEKGLREEDPYDQIVQRAELFETEEDQSFDDVVRAASESLAGRIPIGADRIMQRLIDTGRYGGAPVSHGVALLHFRTRVVKQSEMVLVRARDGLCVSLGTDDPTQDAAPSCEVYALFFLVSPEQKPGQHLRILAQLAERAENESFIGTWRRLDDPERLKETLLRDARFVELFIEENEPTAELIGRRVCDIALPPGAFIVLIRRKDDAFEPRGETTLKPGDHATFIGEPDAIDRLYERYVEG
jgi:amino acid transporter/mannitol/fructose-specific phosphotransferase system IIA component (Ntr-type)